MKLSFVLAIVFLVGCGAKGEYTSVKSSAHDMDMAGSSNGFESAITTKSPGRTSGGKQTNKVESLASAATASTTPVLPAAERKIIYTASISLVVDDFDGLEQKMRDAVKQHQGYLAHSDLGRMQGKQRSGNWTARIPVDQYDNFIKAVSALGVLTSLNQNAADITEEFVDITARIDNKRKLEARILQLLERPEDKIQHVIEVETELARVREEIERMEGRLRYISDQTAMTTVSIDAREERNYQPPQAITLGSRITTAWDNSLTQTGQIFENTVVFFVRNAIGIVAWVIGLTFAWIVFRFAKRKFIGIPAQEY